MKRKVIQIGDSTQLISLPRKWCLSHAIKKGDELEILERQAGLIITTEPGDQLESVEVDVTGLDRTSILLLIRGLYKKGFDEIKVICNNASIPHYRLKDKKSFVNVVHSEVNRLTGVEVIEQRENYCVIKAISEPTLKDIESVMRRLLLLIVDAGRDVVNAAKTNDRVLLETIEEKHDTVSKFTSYSMRLLNQSRTSDQMFLFAIVALLDKVMDYVKNTARLMLISDKKLRPDSIAALEKIFETFEIYQEVHFKLDFDQVSKISCLKEEVRDLVISLQPKLTKEEAFILDTFQSTLELYRGIVELRLAIEYAHGTTNM